MTSDDPHSRIAAVEKALRRVEKRLAKSELRRSELEHLMDTRQAFQTRVLEQVEDAKAEIEALYGRLRDEQALTVKLLNSIMPETVSQELRDTGSVKPRWVENATVMFTDFVDFTKQTETLNPSILVTILDHYYSAFDQIAAAHGVEKVKTIGDAYMCVAGLRGEDAPAERMRQAAAGILAFVQKAESGDLPEGIPAWSIRIGLNSGPVSAGVVGQDRLSFDVWGDTVNTASRVAAAADVNAVLLAESTWSQLPDRETMPSHDTITARGKGQIDVYRLG